MAIRGKTAELLVRLNLALYRPYIWYTKMRVPMFYVLIEKALYGMLRAALLFYRKLRADLEDMGFEVNPYDPCVANKIVIARGLARAVEKRICTHMPSISSLCLCRIAWQLASTSSSLICNTCPSCCKT